MTLQNLMIRIKKLITQIEGDESSGYGSDPKEIGELQGIKETVEAVDNNMSALGELSFFEYCKWQQIKEALK